MRAMSYYSREQAPMAPPAWGRTTNGWYALAAVLRAALLVNVAAYAVDVAGSWWAANRLGSWLDDPTTINLADAHRIDTLNLATSVVELLLMLVTGILFICWIYQAYARPFPEPSALRKSRGWAIGGWFIPFANYVIPYRVVQGVNAASARPPRPDSSLVMWWWGSWVTFSVLGLVARGATPNSDLDHGRRLIHDLQTADTWNAISAVPGVVAALLAALVDARVTANVRAFAVRPPVPTH
jgi:hypothetical protein